MYGRKYMGIERSAFLVDEQGKIAETWYKVSPGRHAEEPARRPGGMSDAAETHRRPPASTAVPVRRRGHRLEPGTCRGRYMDADVATSGSSPATSRGGRRCLAC